MKKNLLRLPVLRWMALVVVRALAASASHHSREKTSADETLPGLGPGDPVYLRTPGDHRKFVALFSPTRQRQGHGRRTVSAFTRRGTDRVLRTALADRGFASLPIQMPSLGRRRVTDFSRGSRAPVEAIVFLTGCTENRDRLAQHRFTHEPGVSRR